MDNKLDEELYFDLQKIGSEMCLELSSKIRHMADSKSRSDLYLKLYSKLHSELGRNLSQALIQD